jgi:small-conductance mechanosensitive channel
MKIINLLSNEHAIYKELEILDPSGKYTQTKKYKLTQLDRFETALDTINATLDVYQKRLEIVEISINKGIEKQVYRLIKIGMVILVVFLIFFLLKLVVKKYITDNERFYMANKIITFTNFIFIILIIFFNYIENVSYLVTILGFASAGIAIAMKDWFMSILGWLVIVFGGSIHVGDRIRVDMDGMQYVGDVMDISLIRITLFEDITLTSIEHNRRAGRIIFIPNNYVFTRMISNYTHNSLKTVWDGVKITITFDSNHKKAMQIAKRVSRKFSKGYTDITRKQLNKLREHYSLKNTNVEPRIFSFINSNGMDIEAWYLTNAYATLTLRSVISTEIVDAYNAEDDITIAYPTQQLYVQTQEKRTPPFDEKERIV